MHNAQGVNAFTAAE